MEIEIIKNILDIKKDVMLTPLNMAKSLSITFFPTGNKSDQIKNFTSQLKNILIELGVKIIPYEDALVELSLKQKMKLIANTIVLNFQIIFKIGKDENINNLKFPIFPKFGKKIKKGIAVIVEGDTVDGMLAMDQLINLRENPIITILQEPKEISRDGKYLNHMNASLNIFAFYMTNLAIIINDDEWAIYSLNGSHPYFSRTNNFKNNILNELIPKISAPVMPPNIKDFVINEGSFNVGDNFYKPYLDDLINGGMLLEKTGLYPKKRSIRELNFRNNYYRWIGSRYLDKRNGMSYGFVARQLPAKLSKIILKEDFDRILNKNEKIFLKFNVLSKELFLVVPDVWVLTSRSGSDKSKLNVKNDIVKIGLVNGRMIIETPLGVDIKGDYKPSFDTRVILAHAVGNAILASLMKFFRPDWYFYKNIENNGAAIAHWHGYINDNSVFGKTIIYGNNNPSVSCSSAQSAIYALNDKMNNGLNYIEKNIEYYSDIHIEPHHGVNIVYDSLVNLANLLLSNKNISNLE